MCVCEGLYLSVPDVDTLVEGAAGQVAPVGAEGHAVDGLLVAGERVDADAALHVPQTHRRVERSAEEERGGRLAGSHRGQTRRESRRRDRAHNVARLNVFQDSRETSCVPIDCNRISCVFSSAPFSYNRSNESISQHVSQTPNTLVIAPVFPPGVRISGGVCDRAGGCLTWPA